MSPVRRFFATALVVFTVGAGTAACGQARNEHVKAVRDALRKTESLSYRFVYQEEALDSVPVEVKGILEDDLRYKTQLSMNGQPMMEEVVSDDAVADRFFNPTAMKIYLDPDGGGGDEANRQGGAEQQGASEADVRAALASSRWVLDPRGAPPLLGSVDMRNLGLDPVYDSLTVFRYLDQVLRINPVLKFNADALDYRPDEDPFRDATPDKLFPGQKVTRYDLLRPPLPKAADTQAGNQLTPGMENFRYMAIYISDDDIILRIDEAIDIGLQLEDLRKNYELDLPEDPEEAIRLSVRAINSVRAAQADPPVRARRMTFTLASIGEENEVALPNEDVVTGSLSVLRNRGRAATGEGLVVVPGSQAATSPTTAPPDDPTTGEAPPAGAEGGSPPTESEPAGGP